MTTLFWTLIILAAAMYVTVLIREMRDWEPPSETVHTLDCLDWRRTGQRDKTCPAHHGTDWFGPRAQIELENALDGQIGVRND